MSKISMAIRDTVSKWDFGSVKFTFGLVCIFAGWGFMVKGYLSYVEGVEWLIYYNGDYFFLVYMLIGIVFIVAGHHITGLGRSIDPL